MPFDSQSEQEVQFSWVPNPGPQTAFVNLPPDIHECFFGGARGGGKSDAVIGLLLVRAEQYGKHFAALVFRREYTQLLGLIERAKEVFGLHGAVWKDDKQTFVFPNGARVEFRHLDKDKDAEKYQGRSVQMVVFEELTNFPREDVYLKMKAILRSPHGVPCQLVSTGNPGGPGHSWVKKRFIDPDRRGFRKITARFWDDKREHWVYSTRLFIPSKAHDNPKLDPNYIANLHQSGSPELVRAWLDGDWDIVEGAYFPEWSHAKHVLPANCRIPAHWRRFRCADWGSAKPFAVYWVAVAEETVSLGGKIIPRGALVVYREWYGISHKPNGDWEANKGVRMFAEQVGAGIVQRERGDPKISLSVLDPGAFARDGGPSIAERIMSGARKAGGSVVFRRADNKRVAGRGAQGGWDIVRARLVGEVCDDVESNDPIPMIFVLEHCTHLIRTLPELQYDKDNPEDLDSDGEDHAADAVRYGCMSRPWVPKQPESEEPPKTWQTVTLDELWAATPKNIDEAWRV